MVERLRGKDVRVTPKNTILIVDDHPLVRQGLKMLLTSKSKFEVIGEAATGAEALEKVSRLKPAVVLMDLSLPDQSGLEVIGNIRNAREKARIIVISMHSKPDYIAKAFQAGAQGYIAKDAAPENILQAIQAVLDGEYFMDSSVSHKVVENLIHPPAAPGLKNQKLDALTAREQEVFVLLAEGLSNDQIAQRLFISLKTAKNHRVSIMRKLGIHNTHELIRNAVKLGLIDPDLWKG